MLYGDLSGFRAFALARGNAAPTDAEDSAALQALQRASDHVRFSFITRLPASLQSVEALPSIEDAAYLCAAIELDTPGFFSRAYTPSEQKVLTRAGDISWTVTGRSDKAGSGMPRLATVEAIFRPHLPDSGSISAFMITT